MTRRPHQDNHSAIKKSDSDVPVLAIVPPVILNGQCRAGEHRPGMRKIEPSDLNRRGALYRIEFNPHILCYYKK